MSAKVDESMHFKKQKKKGKKISLVKVFIKTIVYIFHIKYWAIRNVVRGMCLNRNTVLQQYERILSVFIIFFFFFFVLSPHNISYCEIAFISHISVLRDYKSNTIITPF